MKKYNYALGAVVILFLLVAAASSATAQTIPVSVCLKASDGVTGLAGATVQYAPGGAWYTFGTTGPDGCVSMDLAASYTNVKIKISYNQGNRELIQNIQTNPNYNFQTGETYVQVLDHMGNGLPSVTIQQGGGYWQTHGITGADGKLKLEMFLPGSYKFKATLNNTSQEIVQTMPIVFQTGAVQRDNSYSGTIAGQLGGSWRYLWPTPGTLVQLFAGTYNFTYNPVPAGGSSPEAVTVVAGEVRVIPGGTITPFTLTANIVGSGTVIKAPDQPVYLPGTIVEMTAIPATGWTFTGWSGDATGTANPLNVIMNADKTITATFAINTYTLTYNAGAGGTITGTTPQTVNYNESGTEVTAVPNTGYHFVNWSDGVLTAARTDANVTANIDVTANFALDTYQLTVISAPGGSVTTPASLPATVDHGVATAITVTPVSGYTFNGWIVDAGTATIADASNPTTTVTLTAGDATVKATFTALPGTICGTVKAGTVPLENVKVELRDGNGTEIVSISTNAAGYYCFSTVNPDNYQILIVKPLGYAIVDDGPNYQDVTLDPAETETVNFALINVVLCNRARDFSYWKHQFETHRCFRLNWQERLVDLNNYIAAVHQYYTPHFPIFHNLTTRDDWEDLFTMRATFSMRKKAIKQLAALVMNFVSLKIGQNTIVTKDNKTAGDVLTYVSQLVTNNNPYDDNLARTLAMKVNNGAKIASGIVPDGSILYKGGSGYRQINWGFDVPKEYALEQNYPNPFNPSTVIRIAVPVEGHARLVVYNTLGQEVDELMNGSVKPGTYEVQFNAANLASGMYIYKVVARGSDGSVFTRVRKMLLMK